MSRFYIETHQNKKKEYVHKSIIYEVGSGPTGALEIAIHDTNTMAFPRRAIPQLTVEHLIEAAWRAEIIEG